MPTAAGAAPALALSSAIAPHLSAAPDLDACNLGYARACPRLPARRSADRVSFALGAGAEGRVVLQFALELDHLPVACGNLFYDLERQRWLRAHPDPRVQRQAEAFLAAACREKLAPGGPTAGQLALPFLLAQ